MTAGVNIIAVAGDPAAGNLSAIVDVASFFE